MQDKVSLRRLRRHVEERNKGRAQQISPHPGNGAFCWTGLWLILLLTASAPLLGQTTKAPEVSIRQKAVERIASMRDSVKELGTSHKKSYDLTLSTLGWMDTGADVKAGETADVTATGAFTLGDGRSAGPDGLVRGWKDLLRTFPLNGAPAGALIGRISNQAASVPFLLGAEGRVTMPTSGRLFISVNTSNDLEQVPTGNTGKLRVKLKFDESSLKPSSAVAATSQTPDVSQLVGQNTFATLPRRVVDKDGNEGDMVNFSLVGTKAEIESAFKAAGWVAVDASIEDAVVHGILATLGHEAYTAVPISTLYLFGRGQDLSFEQGDPLRVAAERHHLRAWKTDQTINGRPLWVGSATHDVGFETDQRNGDVTHKIDPKIDDERQFLLKSFDAAGVFTSAAYVLPADPVRTAKTATGGEFYSDGRVVVMALK